MPRMGKSGWELIMQKTGKNRDFFEYNSLRQNEDMESLMKIYRKLYPIARERLYRLSKSDVAETRKFQKWVLDAKPSPTNITGDEQLINAVYDVAHMIANPKFSVSGFHAFEDRQQKTFEENYGLKFKDRMEYREFVRFLDKFSSAVNSGLKYTVSYAYKVFSDVRNYLNAENFNIKTSYIMERFMDFKESAATARGRKFSARQYDFKDLLLDYIKEHSEELRKDYSVFDSNEKTSRLVKREKASREDYLKYYKRQAPKSKKKKGR